MKIWILFFVLFLFLKMMTREGRTGYISYMSVRDTRQRWLRWGWYCASALHGPMELAPRWRFETFLPRFYVKLCCAKQEQRSSAHSREAVGIRLAPAANDRLRSKSRPDWLTSFRAMEEKRRRRERKGPSLYFYFFFFPYLLLVFCLVLFTRSRFRYRRQYT
jgi:hypothetical protein